MESEKKAARVEIFFMRPESSALSLHHIKTTVFTVILVLPCISEPAERSGIEQIDCNELSDQKTEPVQ